MFRTVQLILIAWCAAPTSASAIRSPDNCLTKPSKKRFGRATVRYHGAWKKRGKRYRTKALLDVQADAKCLRIGDEVILANTRGKHRGSGRVHRIQRAGKNTTAWVTIRVAKKYRADLRKRPRRKGDLKEHYTVRFLRTKHSLIQPVQTAARVQLAKPEKLEPKEASPKKPAATMRTLPLNAPQETCPKHYAQRGWTCCETGKAMALPALIDGSGQGRALSPGEGEVDAQIEIPCMPLSGQRILIQVIDGHQGQFSETEYAARLVSTDHMPMGNRLIVGFRVNMGTEDLGLPIEVPHIQVTFLPLSKAKVRTTR